MTKKQTSVSINDLSPLICEIIESGGEATLRVTGNSMLPLFRDRKNDVVLIKCDPSTLKRGDILFYRRDNGKHVLHRIIKVNEDSFDLTGDAQWEIEKGLPKSNSLALAKGYFTESGKYVSCNSLRHRLYSFLWMNTLFIRRWLLAIYRRTILKIKIKQDEKSDNEKQ